jgi:16S rRNA (uracil1498-N3)-methyltransferase
MNLLLLHPHDYISEACVTLSDHRFQHLLKIKKVQLNDTVLAGAINGLIGPARVLHIEPDSITLQVTLTDPAPVSLPVTLIIAMPRPKMLKRILQTATTMGVKHIVFINSYRTEKSYWQSPLLTQEKIDEQLHLGLEQGIDTQLPTVELKKLFKPFVEDELPELCRNKRTLVAHPNSDAICPAADTTETVLLIGPEGGFIPYEIEKLKAAGCQAVHLGERILRVETAVPVLLAKLFII